MENVTEKREKRRIPKEDILRTVALIAFFAGVALLVFWTVSQDGRIAQKNEVQRLLYPLVVGLCGSGLITSCLVALASKQQQTRPVWYYPLLAAGLTVCGLGAAYIFLGIWPVGDRSAMLVDMHHQYAPLLSKLRDMFLGGENFLYSFELGMGASVLPAFAYYLASPLNLLLVFFPEHLLTEGIFIITVIKNMLIAAAATLCLQYVYRRRTPLAVAVGLMYAMMMYVLAYSWNIMWLDVVLVLPLAVMGFEYLMRTGKYLPYVLTLAYALYANYYIAFMLCIFLVLYFLAFLFRDSRPAYQNRKALWRFTVGSLLGGGLAMFLALPTAMALGQTSAAGSGLPDMSSYFDMFKLLGRQLYDVSPTIRSANLPNVYCGVAVLLLVPLFALNRGISPRRRVTYLALLAVMTVSLFLNQPNLVWHGLHSPNDLPYRFSFLYCFVLLLLAYETLTKARTLTPKNILTALFGVIVYLVIEERFGDEVYGFRSIYVTLLFVAVYAALTYVLSRPHIARRGVALLLLTVVTAELTFNATRTFTKLNSQEYYTSHSGYVDNLQTESVRAAVSGMQALSAEDGYQFSRMEFLPRRTCMDTALFNYTGITSFASSNSYRTTRLMGALGYAVNGVNSYMYRSFVPVTDSLLGIRYVALENNVGEHGELTLRDTVTVTGEEGAAETYYLYENTAALPLAWRADSAVKEWGSSFYNPHTTVNSLYSAMTGSADEVLVAMPIAAPEVTMDEITVKSDTGFYIDPYAGNTTVNFTATADLAGRYFVYVDCRSAESANVEYGGNSWSVAVGEPYFIDIGTLAAGETVDVSVTVSGASSGNVFVLRQNGEAFQAAVDTFTENGLVITSFSDTRIEGTLTADEAGAVVTSIPYDEGWTVRVDGKAVDTYILDITEPNDNYETAGGALLGFDIPAGEHTVTFTFVPKGFWAGVAISAVSLLLLIAVVLFTGRLSPIAARTRFDWAVDDADLDKNDPYRLPAPIIPETEESDE